MNTDHAAQPGRAEHLARQHHPRPARPAARSQRYIDELAVTGLTSNPTIYDKAIGGTAAYDDGHPRRRDAGARRREARSSTSRSTTSPGPPTCSARSTTGRGGVDGFVSLEVSPLLAYDTAATIAEAARLHARAGRPNLFIKIPGTTAGLPGDRGDDLRRRAGQRDAALLAASSTSRPADAYTRGIERRIEAGPRPVRRLGRLGLHQPLGRGRGRRGPRRPANRLGHRHRQARLRGLPRLLRVDRWQRLLNEGARPQRLLCASTGTKDPAASDVLYVAGLAAPLTVNTMPEETLLAFADHGSFGTLLGADPGAADTDWPASRRPASTSRPSATICRKRAQQRSWPPGPRCSNGSRPRPARSPGPVDERGRPRQRARPPAPAPARGRREDPGIAGLPNLRDVGGHPTRAGGRVRSETALPVHRPQPDRR